MGNKCYFSDENANGLMQLYTLDKLGEDWSDPLALKGINEGISEANYPFMMTDGTTFYFAAKGKESIGGYDIFVTRADSENGRRSPPGCLRGGGCRPCPAGFSRRLFHFLPTRGVRCRALCHFSGFAVFLHQNVDLILSQKMTRNGDCASGTCTIHGRGGRPKKFFNSTLDSVSKMRYI